jgi:hypothetical protein
LHVILSISLLFIFGATGCKKLTIRSVELASNPNTTLTPPTYDFTKISNTFTRNWMVSSDKPYATEIYGKLFFVGEIAGDQQLAYYDSSLGYAKFLTATSLGFDYTQVGWLFVENGKLFYVARDAIYYSIQYISAQCESDRNADSRFKCCSLCLLQFTEVE